MDVAASAVEKLPKALGRRVAPDGQVGWTVIDRLLDDRAREGSPGTVKELGTQLREVLDPDRVQDAQANAPMLLVGRAATQDAKPCSNSPALLPGGSDVAERERGEGLPEPLSDRRGWRSLARGMEQEHPDLGGLAVGWKLLESLQRIGEQGDMAHAPVHAELAALRQGGGGKEEGRRAAGQ